MYNVKSMNADEFISDEEILSTLEFAEKTRTIKNLYSVL